MRKILVILAVLVGFLLLLRACGESDTPAPAADAPSAPPAVEAPASTTPTPSAAPSTSFDPAPPAKAEAPAAVTVSFVSAEVGNALSADMKVIAPMSSFSGKDTMSASIATTTSDPKQNAKAKVGMKLIYQTGQVLAEQTRDIDFAGTASTAFSVSRPEAWPAGDYTFEFFLDGKSVGTKQVVVK